MSAPELLPYLLKVNGALVLFCAVYYLGLRRLTFFGLNRAFLLFALLFAPTYPLLDFSSWLARTAPRPAELLRLPAEWSGLALPSPTATPAAINWLLVAYWTGVVVFGLRLLVQLLAVRRLHRQARPQALYGWFFRRLSGPVMPFAFWQTVYLNPDRHPAAELPAILAHEHEHVRQWHTIDILLAQLSLVFYWFNPGGWLLRRALHENLEFQADYQVLQTRTHDAKAYQYSLLHQSIEHGPTNEIVCHFNFHLLKTRIAMMNTKPSAPRHLLRYIAVLPLAAGLLFATAASTAAPTEAPVAALKAAVIDVEKEAPISALPPAALAYIVQQYPGYRLIGLTEVRANDGSNLRYKAQIAVGRRPTDVLFDEKGQPLQTGDPLTFLDGKRISQAEVNKLDSNLIESLSVLKRDVALKAFGTDAANGAILIITKQSKDSPEVQEFMRKYGIVNTPASPAVEQLTQLVVSGQGLSTNDLQGRLLLVNGQEASVEKSKVATGQLQSVFVMDAKQATKKYGEKGAKGAVIIQTK
ncbi:M56 family metallopeptidase [Hymenobacter lapidiphilus]|uniref:Peptidase M56 domain-containing protein n=1 Tax=Hymenobacter lapidiphilus TaxID=2608003 RepID=A0A7Y7U4E8_9BACT|nr:M56 family metallopeptidase [Hymenobacter lapidiphilus]NVO30616.1 hypothetical protein [Hymenobacter lapidiphilus]